MRPLTNLAAVLEEERLAFEVADVLRRGHRVVHDLRRAVTAAGDTPAAWEMAEAAALLELELMAFEAEEDERGR